MGKGGPAAQRCSCGLIAEFARDLQTGGLNERRKLSQPAMWAFYQYIRQSVADNKPWDRFAREILTASGSTLQKGAANYFVLHKDVSDLTETTAVTFLGMSITCCRCHNHPP